MIAVTCPQCGSLISKISSLTTIVQCDYCGAKVLMPREDEPSQNVNFQKTPAKPKLINEFGYPIDQEIPFEINQSADSFIGTKLITAFVVLGIGLFIFFLFIPNTKTTSQKTLLKPTPYQTLATVPKPKKDFEILLEFGSKGTSAGLFKSPGEITIDNSGNIYVSDETLRVQRFDASGKFLNLWNVKGSKNETIDKLSADADGNVYVLIGGEIVVYDRDSGKQKYVIADSRKHYIDDFVIRDDGGMQFVCDTDGSEEFVQTDKSKRIVKRFFKIHSNAAETNIPSQAIRIAVDSEGDFYSVFALGDVYGGFSYDEEDLMTFQFAANGKFLNKFAADMVPAAISIDNQGRIYILNSKVISDAKIVVYSRTGSEIKSIKFDKFESIKTMALDRQNNIYLISGEKIRKLKAIEF
jgi:DNA-directed RNA polymerase subunit RPC12/RpoP/DNA-binding beta-propeller fold protein YncE